MLCLPKGVTFFVQNSKDEEDHMKRKIRKVSFGLADVQAANTSRWNTKRLPQDLDAIVIGSGKRGGMCNTLG